MASRRSCGRRRLSTSPDRPGVVPLLARVSWTRRIDIEKNAYHLQSPLNRKPYGSSSGLRPSRERRPSARRAANSAETGSVNGLTAVDVEDVAGDE
jgi:hypothetical protein